jgi:enoyl-CoA hydratase/carnithine racemase
MELAEVIARNAPTGIQVTKRTARKLFEAAEAQAIAALPEIRAAVIGTEDQQEGIRSFVERRPAVLRTADRRLERDTG